MSVSKMKAAKRIAAGGVVPSSVALTRDSGVDTLCQGGSARVGEGQTVQTSTLALLGGGIVAVSVAAAVYLRPLQDEIRAERAAEAEAAQAAATAEQPEEKQREQSHLKRRPLFPLKHLF